MWIEVLEDIPALGIDVCARDSELFLAYRYAKYNGITANAISVFQVKRVKLPHLLMLSRHNSGVAAINFLDRVSVCRRDLLSDGRGCLAICIWFLFECYKAMRRTKSIIGSQTIRGQEMRVQL